MGGGAHILPGVTVGAEAFVATGSIVTRDVPPYRLVMGTPARVVRSVPEEEWFFQPAIMNNEGTKLQPVPSFDLKRQNQPLKIEIGHALDM